MPTVIAADTGYSSTKALKACEENNIDSYIPNFGQYKASREGFIHDKESDSYRCERRVELTTKKRTKTRKDISKNSNEAVRRILRIVRL